MTRGALVMVAVSVAVLVAGAVAQHVLDAGMNAVDGRVNPRQPKLSMASPIYSVNRRSGLMTYNRTNAWQMPEYGIYARYRRGAFEVSEPTRRTGTGSSPSVSRVDQQLQATAASAPAPPSVGQPRPGSRATMQTGTAQHNP